MSQDSKMGPAETGFQDGEYMFFNSDSLMKNTLFSVQYFE